MGARRFRWLALLLLAGGIAFALPHLTDFLAVDACLDRGGAWDHAAKACRGAG